MPVVEGVTARPRLDRRILEANEEKRMYKSPVTKKVLKVLEFLGNQDSPLGVSQLASALSMNKSTLFGILKALEEEGYVIKDQAEKKYAAGEGLLRLSKLALRPPDIAGLARPFLQRLAKVADETAFFGLREDSFMKVVSIVEAQKAIQVSSREGVKLPLVAGAFGKAFLSAISEGELLELLEETGLPRFTENSNQQMGLFLQEIRRARQLGYAPDLEEYVGGVAALAAPVTADGQAIGAVWVAGLSASMQSLKLFRHNPMSEADGQEHRRNDRIVPHFLRPTQDSRSIRYPIAQR
jgi:IclR family transcriptional regulator, KDG regulon repressor